LAKDISQAPETYSEDPLERAPRIELRQLRYFLAVAEELNFTRAAERMGIAQPPLSQQILSLEHQLRVQLFIRSRRHVELTPEGRALVTNARRILNLTQSSARVVQAIARGEEGPLAIGAIFSSIYGVVPQILAEIVRTHPGILPSLQEMTVLQQLAALTDERIDLGLIRGSLSAPELDSMTLFEEPFVLVCPSEGPLALEGDVSLERIARMPLIRVIESANRTFSRQMMSALVERGYELNIVHEVSDTHTLIGLVAAGFGISLVPASLQNIQIPRVRYLPLHEETPSTALRLVWHRQNTSPVLVKVVDLVKTMIEAGAFP
jgi:DNA-binding transcriptional LysR family regulator